jgi:hypothetical protein
MASKKNNTDTARFPTLFLGGNHDAIHLMDLAVIRVNLTGQGTLTAGLR